MLEEVKNRSQRKNRIKNSLFLYFISSFFFVCTSASFAQDELSKWRYKLSEKSRQLTVIEGQIDSLQQVYQKKVTAYERTYRSTIDKKNIFSKAEDAYKRGSENLDIINPDDLVNLLKAYKAADQDYRQALDLTKQQEGERQVIKTELERLKTSKQNKEIEILEVKAAMFDKEMSKPVWTEGYGESILGEDRTMNECRKLAFQYAIRDAMEKGGKMIIESVTQVKEFRLIKDVIRAKAKVLILKQDDSGDYGKVTRLIQGDIIKFVSKVRIQVQSVDTENPYRKRSNELKGIEVPVVELETKMPVIDSEAFETYMRKWPDRISSTGIGGTDPKLRMSQQRTFALNAAKKELLKNINNAVMNLQISDNSNLLDLLNLNESLKSLKITSTFALEDEINNYIKRFKITDTRYMSTGNVELDGHILTNGLKEIIRRYLKNWDSQKQPGYGKKSVPADRRF